MQYVPSRADRLPAPATYASEDRYIGYRDADRAQPYAHYFEETVAPMQGHVVEALSSGPAPAEHGYTVDEAARRMSRPGYEATETGYTTLPNGQILVSILTEMPGVTGEMWDWWFGWHGMETARYKLWHPEAHYYTSMGDDRRSDRSLTDRQRYLDNVSYVDEYLGPDKSRLTVRFLDPTKVGFDQPKPGETVIVARGGLSPAPIAMAWLIHQVRATADGSEMRSRFFFNDFDILRIPPHSVTSRPGGILTTSVGPALRPLISRLGARKPDKIGPAMIQHCAEEMNHLSRFLPALHAEFKGTP